MNRSLRRAVAVAMLVAASLSIPLSASADTDGSFDIRVQITPLECAEPCTEPSPGDDLAATGLDPLLTALTALGLGASGVALITASRRRRAADPAARPPA